MILLRNISLLRRIEKGDERKAAAEALGLSVNAIRSAKILRLSVDARKKSDVHFSYTLAVSAENEDVIVKKHPKLCEKYVEPEPYRFPFSNVNTDSRPVIVGMGPAGLFAALSLAEAGVRCTILERGRPVEERAADVEKFWESGILDETSNVQFGEGGAGTFSDGKLNTGVNDPRMAHILREFVKFGAHEDILYMGKPHIGTDVLRTVLRSIRHRLLYLGCDIRFESRMTDIFSENGAVSGIEVESKGERYTLPCTHVILAPGNGARDTFEMLHRREVSLSPKSFAAGVRIEHKQSMIDASQYGEAATLGTLPASNYKLAVHLESGRGVFTFCVCPGGSVVAAASENGLLVTNGMSEYARDKENCNGGLLVSVTPEDFPGSPLAGIGFQRSLEAAAFAHGGGTFAAPAQLVGDFLARRKSSGPKSVTPTYRPSVNYVNLWDVLPKFMCEALAEALPIMDRRIRGFASDDAVMTAVETRSSCPVRINRDNFESVSLSGLYPCGEGAGYAGGIMSAAADGIKCAEAVCKNIMSTILK